jgi:hypothetical protein
MITNDYGATATRLLALEFRRTGMLARWREQRAAKHAGNLMVQKVRARASGRPGPRVQSGAYRASIRFAVLEYPGATTVSVGTDAPQAFRLEFGYTGSDSLGRQYSQPPYPHWRPAIAEMEQIWPELITNALLEGL